MRHVVEKILEMRHKRDKYMLRLIWPDGAMTENRPLYLHKVNLF